jgi:hypothetical protein
MGFSDKYPLSRRHHLLISNNNTYNIFLGIIFLLITGIVNADKDVDSDGDGLTDIEETQVYKTDPQLADTDTDGLTDGVEINKYWTLPLVSDTDGDGYLDGVEVRLKTDPLEASSHPDPNNPANNDLDADGLSNQEEREYGTDPQRVDSDFDGLNDGAEIKDYFTDPTLADTDGDGIWDGEEVKEGTDPGNPNDHQMMTNKPNRVIK